MATPNLYARIEDEHLTCTICYNRFTAPRVLPCLHTFCEHCLREYVVSRGYEPTGQFSCPLCRAVTPIPAGGIEQLPCDYRVVSLLDTVDRTKWRPTPKPRTSLQPKAESDDGASAPPPYSAVAPSAPEVCASPNVHGWMEGGGHSQPPLSHGQPPPYYPPPPPPQPPGQFATGVACPMTPGGGAPALSLQGVTVGGTPTPHPGPLLYPAIPASPSEASPAPCSQGLLLKFGKKGAGPTDFQKPFGLAVSHDCDYALTDLSGNRILVFDYKGEPRKAFQCDCRLKDVAVNGRKEVVVVVNKPGAALRCYNLCGQCVGEHGKSITHEESNGVALLHSGGAVVTGKQNFSVYILTDQLKLSSKFGRKGTGDGYFLSPAFVAVDSKGHIVVTDEANHNVQVFNSQGRFKLRFGTKGSGPDQLLQPLGVTTDADDNIFVADSGNFRVQMFSSKGVFLRTIVTGTDQLGEEVRPVNVAMTPRGNVVVLLKGNYFAEVRIYNPYTSAQGPSSVKETSGSTWYMVH